MRIEWTEHASHALEHIFTCSQEYYSKRLLRRLNADIKQSERMLADNPLMGSVESLTRNKDVEYRYIVLCRPFKLIYFIYEGGIYIADIWDTRRLPQNLARNIS
ncbi:MAG: type II toxin-antitoxin system RelE/ParE family toxin [Bacteroidaceae bacterium]|nr:type II toxin-antitoxin system RelE/ParE family toxin [Bacteroidaceae bacterium]